MGIAQHADVADMSFTCLRACPEFCVSLPRIVGARQGRHRPTWDSGSCPRSATWLVIAPGATSS